MNACVARHDLEFPAADCDALRAAVQEGSVLCTLIGVDGGFSRGVGAQFTVLADGSTVGDMTGGCLEAALVTEAKDAAATGRARLLRYGQGSPFIDIRLPCGGGVDCFIDPMPDRSMLARAVQHLDRRQTAALSFSLPAAGEHYSVDAAADGQASAWNEPAGSFTRVYHPPLRLLLFGIGPEMHALAHLARLYGCAVETFWPAGQSDRPQNGSHLWLGKAPAIEVDASSAMVLLFHEHEWEMGILPWALQSKAFFIGAMGGARTCERRLEQLKRMGMNDESLRRLRAPIGLIPRVKNAKALGLSVLAQVVEAHLDKMAGPPVRPAER